MQILSPKQTSPSPHYTPREAPRVNSFRGGLSIDIDGYRRLSWDQLAMVAVVSVLKDQDSEFGSGQLEAGNSRASQLGVLIYLNGEEAPFFAPAGRVPIVVTLDQVPDLEDNLRAWIRSLDSLQPKLFSTGATRDFVAGQPAPLVDRDRLLELSTSLGEALAENRPEATEAPGDLYEPGEANAAVDTVYSGSPPVASTPPPPPFVVDSVIGQTFKITFGHFGKLLLVCLAACWPFLVLVTALALLAQVLGSSDIGEAIIVVLVLLLALLGMFTVGRLLSGIYQFVSDVMNSRPALVGGATRAMSSALMVIVTAVVIALVTSVGLLLLIIPGIMIGIASSVALPAVVEERLGPIKALERSWQLTRGYRWSVFGIQVLLGVLSFGISLAGGFILGFFSDHAGGLIFSVVLLTLLNVATALLGYVSQGVMYHRLRWVQDPDLDYRPASTGV